MNLFFRHRLRAFVVILTSTILFSFQCEEENYFDSEQLAVENALNDLVVGLERDFPADVVGLKLRLQEYLEKSPSYFYGATIAVLNAEGTVVNSPYYYRISQIELGFTDGLMSAAYEIDKQPWLRGAIDSGSAVWSDPYFDEGGGNIWMQTLSVPVFAEGKIIAVATTDLAVDAP